MSRLILFIVALVLAATVHASNTMVITVGNNGSLAFDPQVATIQPGDTVVWRFAGGPHTVTQSNGPKSCNASVPAGFDSSRKQLGDSFALTFSTPGKIWYYCTVGAHCSGKGMYGTLLVGVAADGGANTTDGAAAPTTGAASSGRGSTHMAIVTAVVMLSSMVVAGFLL